jgi:two-component sensor histidine kinase
MVIASRRLGPAARWGIALLMFATALAARLVLARYVAGVPAITFLPALIGATLLCGWQPAVLVLVLSITSGVYLFQPQSWGASDAHTRGVIALAVFVAVAVFEIVIISALMNAVRANHRLAQQEKTMFLELQHRVANTLQFVAGMLTMARQGITTPEQADLVLEQAVARVTAMGQLYRRMYDAANDDRGLMPLLGEILDELFKDLNVTTKLHADLAQVPLSQMTPIVLLVTEAATNSAKHVFRSGQGSTFDVALLDVPPARLRLVIKDDGPGVPVPPPPSHGLGLRIMQGLATQLGGRLVFDCSAGTVVSVEFART